MADENQKVDLTHFKYGRRLQLTFTFEFTKTLSLMESFEDHSVGDFKSITMDELPDDFKKQFNQAYADLKQSYANAKPGQFTGNAKGSNPPPL